MIARGDLRDDAAEAVVQLDLGSDLSGEQLAGGAEDGDGGFVAGGFDGENRGIFDFRFSIFD